jgi:Tol biopolymer transport system component
MFHKINKLALAFRFISLTVLIIAGVAGILGSNEGSTPGTSRPNINYVAFLADKDTPNTVELYAYSLETRGVIKLNDTLVSGGNVTSFSISPDGLQVAYVADQDTDGRFELYVAASNGSTVTKVSEPTVNLGSDVGDDPVWSPDGSRIAYRSNESDRGNEIFVLRTVQPDGSNNVIVNPTGNGAGKVMANRFAWAPNSSRIAYLSDQDITGVIELYTSPADSPLDNQKVNNDLALNESVTQYAWAPNGSKIAYRADQSADEIYELWTSTPTGGANTRISGSYTGSERDALDAFSWAPDSSRIAYIADENTDEIFELYTVQPDGSGRLKVSANITTPGFNVFGIPAWAPDSSRIAYLADMNQNDVYELFTSQPAVATTSTRVNRTLRGGRVLTGPKIDSEPAWSPDSTTIAYIAQQDTAGIYEVYVGKPDGTGTVKVSGTLTTNNSVSLGPYTEVWAPDGSRLTYMADQSDVNTQDLYTTIPTSRANIARITRTPVQANSLKSFGKWAPDSSHIVYVSAQDIADVDELYMASPDGSSNRNISGALVSGGDVDSESFVWAP